MNSKKERSASGISPDAIAAEYEHRSMQTWSDHDLGAAVSEVVQQSRSGTFDSFVLHAPLETAARTALLSHASPSQRTLARLRMVSIAARYEAFGLPVPTPPTASSGDSVGRFIAAVQHGDPDSAEAAALDLVQTHNRRQLVEALAEFVIPLTSAAAHTPIFLHLLQRSDPRGPINGSLLLPLSRELASDTGKAIQGVQGRIADRPTDPSALLHVLMSTPSQPTESTFIHPMVEAVDASGLAEQLLGNTVGHFNRQAASSILRVAAMSMLQDTPDEAPYGWTHCLTIPQAIIEIAHATPRPDIAMAAAATHIVGMRAALGCVELSDRPLDSYPDVDFGDVIDAAVVHHDAHVVKYVLACIDAAAFDPAARNLYHGAAAHLLAIWAQRPADDDPLPPAQNNTDSDAPS